MTHPIRPFRNIILPAMILFPLMVLIVGCLYIPTFENVDLKNGKRDFRPLLSEKDSTKPIAARRITQAKVQDLLGSPQFRSPNNRVWVYTVNTKQGIWVYPQCFSASYSGQYVRALSLRFDEQWVLERFHVVNKDCQVAVGFNIIGYIDERAAFANALQWAIYEINADNGIEEDFRDWMSKTDNRSPFFIHNPRLDR